jgi:hypothetical protein
MIVSTYKNVEKLPAKNKKKFIGLLYEMNFNKAHDLYSMYSLEYVWFTSDDYIPYFFKDNKLFRHPLLLDIFNDNYPIIPKINFLFEDEYIEDLKYFQKQSHKTILIRHALNENKYNIAIELLKIYNVNNQDFFNIREFFTYIANRGSLEQLRIIEPFIFPVMNKEEFYCNIICEMEYSSYSQFYKDQYDLFCTIFNKDYLKYDIFPNSRIVTILNCIKHKNYLIATAYYDNEYKLSSIDELYSSLKKSINKSSIEELKHIDLTHPLWITISGSNMKEIKKRIDKKLTLTV